jgi:aminoglycoside phosphotransferase family enzyme/predicted kinase
MVELGSLIEALSLPNAYSYPVEAVKVRQTHISVVFLAGPYAYKVKKPVNLGFLDFDSLEKRRRFCDEEVRLNRRLAPHVYLGVVPAVRTGQGIQLEGEGEVVEWAVKMRRLPDEATLQERVRRNEVGTDLLQSLARRIAYFHQVAETNERIAAFGRFDVVAPVILDIFAQAASHLETTVSKTVFDRVRSLAGETLDRLRPLIETRAARRVPRDCHGDMHLDHVYYFPGEKPPADLVIVDCIEFNERFRFIDPVSDIAFPAMDFAFQGRRDLARRFADTYFDATRDEEGRPLLPLYTAYRATVRGLVDGIKLTEREVAMGERTAALERARAHWLLALTELERPVQKPCLLLVAGLPGSGKSKLAQGLAEGAAFSIVRSDIVRKELAGIPGERPTPLDLRDSLYTRAWNDRTYAECLNRAEKLLFAGKRVLVDATFREAQKRQTFLMAAVKWGVPSALLHCHAEPYTVRRRMETRQADASDADWPVYLQLAETWEPVHLLAGQVLYSISTEGSPAQALYRAFEALRDAGLY